MVFQNTPLSVTLPFAISPVQTWRLKRNQSNQSKYKFGSPKRWLINNVLLSSNKELQITQAVAQAPACCATHSQLPVTPGF